MILKNVAQKVHVYAYDATTGAGKTGDAANITGYVSLDGTANAIDDTNPAEVDATNTPGLYVFDLTAAETNANAWALIAKSSTANIRIDPIIGFTSAGVISTDAVVTGAVVSDGGNTASSFQTTLDEADGYWIGCMIRITSGALAGQVHLIGDFDNTNGVVTLETGEAFSGVPAGDVTFEILNR